MINPDATIHFNHIGNGEFPIIVVDDFVKEPELMVELAGKSDFKSEPGDFYPGVRAEIPDAISSELVEAAAPLLLETTGDNDRNVECLFSAWSLTTQSPDSLKPIQCIPHFDDTNANKFAMVHYLFRDNLGGTSFFRHIKTQIEAVTTENQQKYMKALGVQATTEGLPETAYLKGSSKLFTEYHHVKPKFNRAIFYPSNILHSGIIHPKVSLSKHPQSGRLTTNMAFLLSKS